MAQPTSSYRVLILDSRAVSDLGDDAVFCSRSRVGCILKFRRRHARHYKLQCAPYLWRSARSWRWLRASRRRRSPSSQAAAGFLAYRRASPAKNSQAKHRLIKCDWSDRLGYVAIALVSLRRNDRAQVLGDYLRRWKLAQIERTTHRRHKSRRQQ